MTYVIGEPRVDVKDRACVEECPVDSIYEEDLPLASAGYRADNTRFFTETLPGQNEPLDSPAGASRVGPLEVDTAMVIALPLERR